MTEMASKVVIVDDGKHRLVECPHCASEQLINVKTVLMGCGACGEIFVPENNLSPKEAKND